MIHKFFDKKSAGDALNNENMTNKKWAQESNKSIIRKFEKRKVYSSFIDNIWGADLADMQLISKFDKGIRFLLCVIDIFSKHAWIIPLKTKKGITITNAFLKILDESHRKPNKIWVYKGVRNGKTRVTSYKLKT